MVSYRPANGQPENFTGFNSALGRALFMISHPNAVILKQWEENKTELEWMGDDIERMVEELPAVRQRIQIEAQRRARRES
jgi:hypothetical protein